MQTLENSENIKLNLTSWCPEPGVPIYVHIGRGFKCVLYYTAQIILLQSLKALIPIAVDPVLHSKMVVEKLGGGEDHGADDGPRRGGGQRGGEEAEEEAAAGLSLRQFEEPQLVGLQILLL